MYFKPQSYFYLGLAISLTTLILCILYLIFNGMRPQFDALKSLKPNLLRRGFMIWDWRKNRTQKKHDAPKNITEPVSAATPIPPKEVPERKTGAHEKLESITKSIDALRQLVHRKENAWKAPEKSIIRKLTGALKNPFAPKDSEMAPLKNYIVHKKS